MQDHGRLNQGVHGSVAVVATGQHIAITAQSYLLYMH